MISVKYPKQNNLCQNPNKDLSDDKIGLPFEKNNDSYSTEKHVCATCKQEIENEISRIVLMKDKDGGPRLLCFHFFFPCWDLGLLVQQYPFLEIDHLGYSIPEGIHMKEDSIRDLQKNLQMWYYPRVIVGNGAEKSL